MKKILFVSVALIALFALRVNAQTGPYIDVYGGPSSSADPGYDCHESMMVILYALDNSGNIVGETKPMSVATLEGGNPWDYSAVGTNWTTDPGVSTPPNDWEFGAADVYTSCNGINPSSSSGSCVINPSTLIYYDAIHVERGISGAIGCEEFSSPGCNFCTPGIALEVRLNPSTAASLHID